MEGPLHAETVVSRHFDSELISCTLIYARLTTATLDAQARTIFASHRVV